MKRGAGGVTQLFNYGVVFLFLFFSLTGAGNYLKYSDFDFISRIKLLLMVWY